MVENILNIALLILGCAIIVLVLFQGGRNNSDNVLMGKKSLSLYKTVKERGFDKKLVQATAIVGILYIACAIVFNKIV